ncbi:MAG: protein kinase [Elusimicrobia bacterium]|nr:protein kinase [Elusimicrobiota bacterium]
MEAPSGFGKVRKEAGGAACMSKFRPLLSYAENTKDWRRKIAYYTQAINGWLPCDGKAKKAEAYTGRGFARAQTGDYFAAENDFKTAVRINPEDPMPHNYLGCIYSDLRKYDAAVEEFQMAFAYQLEDKDPVAARAAGVTYAAALKEQEKAAREKAERKRAETRNAQSPPPNQSGEPFNAPAGPPPGQPPRIPPGAAPVSLSNPAVLGQDPQRTGGLANTSADLPKPGEAPGTKPPQPGKPAGSDWVRYCVIGLFLATTLFLTITYLVLKSDQDRIRQELGPLAKELGVDVQWMFFGFFIPPDTEFHGKLMITLVICSVLGSIAAGLVFFNFSLDTAIKILSGPIISGAIACLSVFASYSLKTGSGGGGAGMEPQAGWGPPAAPPQSLGGSPAEAPNYKRAPASIPDFSGLESRPETTGRELRSSATRSRQVKALMDAGNYREALEVFSRKRQLRITDADKDQLFEIYIRLGDFDRAANLFDSLKGSALLTGNIARYEELAALCHNKGGQSLARRICRGLFEAVKPVVRTAAGAPMYYKLAAFCESMDDSELARDIFRHMIEAGFEKFKDVSARYEELKTKLFVAVAPAQGNAPAAGAAGSGNTVIGTVLNNQYEIKGELGEGGMAKVYEGLDRKSNRKVAVKKMHPWLKKFPEEHKRFVQEARIVSRLAHPNIVGVQAIVEQEGEIYLIFDYVDGKTLADVLKEKGLLQFQECKGILKGVCGAVHYAHKINVIHRDLKPSNIMVDRDGAALVMDFGLASELRESLTRVTHQTTSGTPAYMAPEQYLGVVKRESDIYAMGVCLYEMLTGKLPFATGDIMQLKNDREFRELSSQLPWLPSGIDEIVSRALAPEPSQRFADPMEFFDALNKL